VAAEDDSAADDGETTPSTEDATVALGDTSLGKVLVDPEGFTLYVFTKDTPTTSACGEGCISNWPPVTVTDDPVAGDGLDADLLGTITRDDGKEQVTYGDHPLYRFAPDSKPGDTKGQGVGGIWFAVGADGKPVEKSTTSTNAMSGY
jgi:predicted lipoprotein with Yx(FWY)xxD motif